MIDAKITVDDTQVRKALAALTSEDTRRDMALVVADEVVLPAIQKYPPQSGKPMQWANDRQRRAFFAKLRSGAITVPYQRTGNYGGSFQKQMIRDGVALVSHLPYAPYVRGEEQAAYHRGNWDTLEQIALAQEQSAADAALVVVLAAVGDATV